MHELCIACSVLWGIVPTIALRSLPLVQETVLENRVDVERIRWPCWVPGQPAASRVLTH
jgi:hypothetical protein